MKKIFLLAGALALLSLVSCSKEKTCRCAVLNSQEIRMIQIDKGDCRDVRFVFYDRDILHPDLVDSVLCTDFHFASDTLSNK